MPLTKQERLEEHINIKFGNEKVWWEELQVGNVRETGRVQTTKTLMKSGLHDVGQKFYAYSKGPLKPQPQACACVSTCLLR